MPQNTPIPIVDLFAGPGGLGEGFSAVNEGSAFRITVSAEMNAYAHQTLVLRAFYRILKGQGAEALESYYRFCNGEATSPWDDSNLDSWKEAQNEARQIELGTPDGNRELNGILDKSGLGASKPWVLIGGPPCQAYSIVGRSRNRGVLNYRAEEDQRHFLYKEYLRIIQEYRPAVFIMENVKGILSAKVHDQHIFHTILRDLSDPDFAVTKKHGTGYRIHSLVMPTVYERGMSPDEIDVHDFIIKSEDFGIPQARHRVILLGIREDIPCKPGLLVAAPTTNVREALSGLPPLRSRISQDTDSGEKWSALFKEHLRELLHESSNRPDLEKLANNLREIRRYPGELGFGSLREKKTAQDPEPTTALERWYHDENLNVILNHETRSHMASDLRRYLYAAAYAKAYDKSPKSHTGFDLVGLRPEHLNWETGKFDDRFRVQRYENPATTVTSHISKDGHYFIHPDPTQCRSLTVREAARLQTFPDNYFFQGNRTHQFHQVGNAVPPMLAYKIASIVKQILS